jgi:hypothetical protein
MIDRRIQIIEGPNEAADQLKVSNLRNHRYLVLLGEPAIGKTDRMPAIRAPRVSV